MDKLIMYKENREEKSGNSLLQCSKDVETEVKALAKQTGRLPKNVTDDLLRFALARVEVKIQEED